MSSIIKVSQLYKQFGDNVILKDFSLEIEEGTMIAIQGKSGSGKSTILNIIATIEGYDQGVVEVFNQINVKPNSKKSENLLRTRIAYLFQNYALIDNLSVKENLKIALKYSKNKSSDDISTVLKSVGLEGFENKKIFELSGGEQQRVALARVMLKPCDLVLADEPTGNVDEENKIKIMEIFKTLNMLGKTIVIVTHDVSLNEYFDHVILIDNGEKV